MKNYIVCINDDRGSQSTPAAIGIPRRQ